MIKKKQERKKKQKTKKKKQKKHENLVCLRGCVLLFVAYVQTRIVRYFIMRQQSNIIDITKHKNKKTKRRFY